MNRKMLTFVLALGALVAMMAWLSGSFEAKLGTDPVALPDAGATAGTTQVVASRLEPVYETATGTISARDETVISSRILAMIRTVRVRAGDRVAVGDVLVELDDRDLAQRTEQARQGVAAVESGERQARSEFDRIAALVQRQVASRAEYDRASSALATAVAELERARRALGEAETARSYGTITSPIEGNVIERFADPGDTAAPGVPLLRIYNPGLLRLDASVRETLALTLRVGDALDADIDAIGERLAVRIDEIVPTADPGSRSFTIKALLPQGRQLYPGMFGRLQIPTATARRIYVPELAIRHIGQLDFVLVRDDGREQRRFVRTGRAASGDLREVVSGLADGEQIVVPHGAE